MSGAGNVRRALGVAAVAVLCGLPGCAKKVHTGKFGSGGGPVTPPPVVPMGILWVVNNAADLVVYRFDADGYLQHTALSGWIVANTIPAGVVTLTIDSGSSSCVPTTTAPQTCVFTLAVGQSTTLYVSGACPTLAVTCPP